MTKTDDGGLNIQAAIDYIKNLGFVQINSNHLIGAMNSLRTPVAQEPTCTGPHASGLECPVHKPKECWHEWSNERESKCIKCGKLLETVDKPKPSETLQEIANIARVYSGWDIGEANCIRIAEKVVAHYVSIIAAARQEGYNQGSIDAVPTKALAQAREEGYKLGVKYMADNMRDVLDNIE